MNKEEIIEILQNSMPYLKANFGLRSIALFGSFAKGNARKDSDVDFLIDIEPPLSKNYFGLLVYLEKLLSRPVGLIRKGGHKDDRFLSSIKEDLIYAT